MYEAVPVTPYTPELTREALDELRWSIAQTSATTDLAKAIVRAMVRLQYWGQD